MKNIFFIIAYFIFCGLNIYIYYSFQKIIPNKILKYIFLSIQILSILALLLRKFLPHDNYNLLYRIGTSYLIIFIYLLIFCAVKDLLSFIPSLKPILYNNYYTCVVILLLFLCLFSFGYFNYKNKKRIEIAIESQKISTPLKIIAISDMHLGYGISKKEFSEWVDIINNENPDLLLIAGDIIDNSAKLLFEKNYAEVFKKIKSKYGIYAVFGNHDGFAINGETVSFFNKSGINILSDTIINLRDDIQIIGRKDKSDSNRKELYEICKNIDSNKFNILLDHQPYNLELTEKNNIDFQFSGHTHAGQIFPITLITKLIYENNYGLLKKGNSTIYVSSGIGIWGGKFRLGSCSEYVVMQLNKG